MGRGAGMLVVANVLVQTIVAYVHLLSMNVTFVVTDTCYSQCSLHMNVEFAAADICCD